VRGARSKLRGQFIGALHQRVDFAIRYIFLTRPSVRLRGEFGNRLGQRVVFGDGRLDLIAGEIEAIRDSAAKRTLALTVPLY
jgi:hypothetical protein